MKTTTANAGLVEKYAAPVPRYTSYPTAPHFHNGVDGATYGRWLDALDERSKLSLYLHIPYCDTLCWFCGCHTKITRRHTPVTEYLVALMAEVEIVAERARQAGEVTHVHWGGGSPTILSADEIVALTKALRSNFRFGEHAEFAVEIDPRGLDGDRIAALGRAGVTRASLGVQDLDPKVQVAINRVQPYEETRDVVVQLREQGVRSLNLDLIYGLPHQTVDGIRDTITRCAALRPDRIALFGYAHVPWMKTHQRLIDETVLPGLHERFEQSQAAAEQLEREGYLPIGLDHYARAEDGLAQAAQAGTLRRNFQGYTTDGADALIGLGASAIGKMPQGYVQNSPAIADYRRKSLNGELATVRGVELTDDDRVRADIIEQLMCDFRFDLGDVQERFGTAAGPVIADAERIAASDEDGLIELEDGRFEIPPHGRPFVRSICAAFDAHLGRSEARHSAAV